MKSFLIISLLFWAIQTANAQNVGIGTNTPNVAAKLDVQSTNSGILIPRLTSAQINAIVSPPNGLMVFDSTKNVFSYYNGSQWIDIKPVAADDSIWSSLMANSELNIYNAKGQHTYVGGLPMLSTGSGGTIDGVFRIEHGSPFPVTTRYFVTMDGKGMQARSQLNFLSPQVDANLLLNPYGGNVGLGLFNPQKAKLETEGSVGNTMAMFKRFSNSQGISLVGDWPGVYFNSYFNGGSKAMSSTGYSGLINLEQNAGAFTFSIEPQLNTSANQVLTLPEVMRITKEGSVGIGTSSPAAKLHVTSADPVYSGILGTGNGYTTSTFYVSGYPYTLYSHGSGIKAQATNKAVALEIDGPVAISSTNNDFVFNIFCQLSDASKMGYYTSLGNGYWAINLTGSDSPLNEISFANNYIYVTPFFSWSNVPSTFNIPSKQMLWYNNTDGKIQWVTDVEPIQIGKPIIQLRIMVIRINPSSRPQ